MEIADNNQEHLDPIDILARAKRLKKTQKYFATIHNRTESQVSQAFKGKQPGLLKRISEHISKLESKIN